MLHHTLQTVGLALILPVTALLFIIVLEYLPNDRAEEMPYPGRLAGTPRKIKAPRRRRSNAA
jgi:hypothetical protein